MALMNTATRTTSYYDPETEDYRALTGPTRSEAGWRNGPEYRVAVRTAPGVVVEITRHTDCGDLGTNRRELRGWPAWAR